MPVLVILLMVVTLNFLAFHDESRELRTKADVKTLAMAAELFEAKYGQLPSSILDILKDGKIVSVPPIDSYKPSEPIKYGISPDSRNYAVWSTGRDGRSSEFLNWSGDSPVPYDTDDIGATSGTIPNRNWDIFN